MGTVLLALLQLTLLDKSMAIFQLLAQVQAMEMKQENIL